MNQAERAAKIADLEMFLWDKRSERAAARKRLDEINQDIDNAQRELRTLNASGFVVTQGELTWPEAEEAMKQGKKVRRPQWMPGDYAYAEIANGNIFWGQTGEPYSPIYSCRHATDWEVVE